MLTQRQRQLLVAAPHHDTAAKMVKQKSSFQRLLGTVDYACFRKRISATSLFGAYTARARDPAQLPSYCGQFFGLYVTFCSHLTRGTRAAVALLAMFIALNASYFLDVNPKRSGCTLIYCVLF